MDHRLALLLTAALLASGCGGEPRADSSPSPTPSRAGCEPPDEEAAVTDHWQVPPECELEPYPFMTPTPPPEPTPVDGTYERRVTRDLAGPVGKCRRCPPYRMELGQRNILMLDRGVFRLVHQPGEWRNVGHFEVHGGTVTLFNDPNCTATRGTYRWEIQGGALTLEAVEDDCAFGGLRSRYLTATSWDRTGG